MKKYYHQIIIGVNIFFYVLVNLLDKKFNFVSFIFLQFIFQFYIQTTLYIFKYRPYLIDFSFIIPKKKGLKKVYYFFKWIFLGSLKIFLNGLIYAMFFKFFNIFLSDLTNFFVIWAWIFFGFFLKDNSFKKLLKNVVYFFLIIFNFYFISQNISIIYEEKNLSNSDIFTKNSKNIVL
jgi:hypothetical protein